MESAAALESLNFNPRSPCGERRFTSTATATGTGFQSTLPVWGATGAGELCGASLGNFNPRSPCGERPHPDLVFVAIFDRFQSTLPVWGATHCSRRRFSHPRHFNPRSPCGERPQQLDSQAGGAIISIHAPRVGSDAAKGQLKPNEFYISIHAPRVGSDRLAFFEGPMDIISIHAPRVGSDAGALPCRDTAKYFNPRSPCGERQRSWP